MFLPTFFLDFGLIDISRDRRTPFCRFTLELFQGRLRRKAARTTTTTAKMTTYKVVMIRHGESEWNKMNKFCGWFDADLSELGIEEAKSAGKVKISLLKKKLPPTLV